MKLSSKENHFYCIRRPRLAHFEPNRSSVEDKPNDKNKNFRLQREPTYSTNLLALYWANHVGKWSNIHKNN